MGGQGRTGRTAKQKRAEMPVFVCKVLILLISEAVETKRERI